MKIVNSDLNFLLLEIVDLQGSNNLKLILTDILSIPRKLELNRQKKIELQLNGIADKKSLKSKLENSLNEYIDIEKTKENYLDFWSEQYQIGEFKIDNYTEVFIELNKEDWIDKYQKLLDSFYKEFDKKTEKSRLESRFLERLEKLTVDEFEKYERKSEFFKNDKDKIESLTNRLNLANRIDEIRKQYITEMKGIK